MSSIKKLTQKRLFLPIFSMILVMLINVVYDIATGSAPLGFFMISIKNGVLYGRLIDILNRGSEIAILAIGMTLVVSASGGTDISVGSVMSLAASFCCMLLAGYGVSSTNELARPLIIGVLGGILIGLSRTTAAEFTFFLAVPVMAGASLLKILKFGLAFSGAEMMILLVGMAVSFVVSVLVIKFLMNYIRKHDFKIFGWYRIVLGVIVLLYFVIKTVILKA